MNPGDSALLTDLYQLTMVKIFELPERVSGDHALGRARFAMKTLADCRVDLLLAGHFHVGATGRTATRYRIQNYVAMWRPMELFLYEWWPLLRPGRTYEKMSQMRVEVRPRAPG